jgi:hypothetical protein
LKRNWLSQKSKVKSQKVKSQKLESQKVK